MSTIETFRKKFAEIANQEGLLKQEVLVKVKPLTTEQAIGTPERDDFPLQKGKERIIEADFLGSQGQAFTDSFHNFKSDVSGLLGLELSDRFNASVFIAAANAVLRHLDLTDRTVHCRDKEPTQCAPQLVDYLRQAHPEAKRVALVGLQPAMAAALGKVYELAILDLDPDNLGRQVGGAKVRNGATDLEEVADWADILVSTGSTLSNLSMDQIRQAAGEKPVVFFGITVSGAASLLGLERFCPLGH
ncbi:MAG: hypothetical protein KQI62_14185 [Deltaproteobacteria bacterium]|nr:hypothetical protein [Deltaproteobacteria bacterium]